MQIESVKFLLWVEDMDRAIAFWKTAVGLGSRLETPHWTELIHGTTVIALHGGGDAAFLQTGLGLQVADVEAACREIGEAGGTVRNPPVLREREGIKLADVTDTEGNGFALSEWIGFGAPDA
jgi:predicted enzyme related to lactoylglutathione lyase